jgi:hypothetical protein
MEYLDINHSEWSKMWDELAAYKINSGDHLCVNDGHCWEYMGSTLDHHHFRHACHPGSHRVEYIYIERARAAVGWA